VLISLRMHCRNAEIEQTYADSIANNVSLEDRVARCRTIYPEMHTLEAWAKTPRADPEWAPGWNNVSIKDLLAGKV
jgi:hypothetical protein